MSRLLFTTRSRSAEALAEADAETAPVAEIRLGGVGTIQLLRPAGFTVVIFTDLFDIKVAERT